MKLEIAAALYSLGCLDGEEIPLIALEAMATYPFSLSLAAIAGSNSPTLRDISEDFVAALNELSIPIP